VFYGGKKVDAILDDGVICARLQKAKATSGKSPAKNFDFPGAAHSMQKVSLVPFGAKALRASSTYLPQFCKKSKSGRRFMSLAHDMSDLIST